MVDRPRLAVKSAESGMSKQIKTTVIGDTKSRNLLDLNKRGKVVHIFVQLPYNIPVS